MPQELSLHRLRDVPPGASAEARAGALMRRVPAPAPLREEAVARVSVALTRAPRSLLTSSRGLRLSFAMGGLVAGSMAFAAAAHFDLPARLMSSLLTRFAGTPPPPAPIPSVPDSAPAATAPTPLQTSPLPAVVEPSQHAQRAVPNSAPPGPARPVHPPAAPPIPLAQAVPAPATAGGTLGAEAALLGQAVQARGAGHPAQALAALDAYASKFPDGQFKSDAVLARINALLDLGRRKDALAVLEGMEPPELAAVPRSNELRVVHGELLAEYGRCKDALDTFDSALAGALPAPVEERARYGRALCLARGGDAESLQGAATEYLERFPDGRHAAQVRALSPP